MVGDRRTERRHRHLNIFYSVPDMGAEHCDERVCPSVCVCVSVRDHIYTFDLRHILVHVTYILLWRRSDTLCIILPVVWLTLYMLITKVSPRRRLAESQCTRSLGLGYKLCAVIPVAGQRTNGTTFRALNVTCQVATSGAESAGVRFMTALFVKYFSANSLP